MQSTFWQLDGHIARLTLPRLSLEFDADQPGEGLRNLVVVDRPWPQGRLLGVAGPIPSAASGALTDWHVRGDDLIAVYETGQPDAARIDLLWHVARPVAGVSWLARIDLLVSIRTDRLDWRHDVRLESVIPAATACEELPPAGDRFVGKDWDWSLALLVHPADLRKRELSGLPGAQCLCQRLFPMESLEKGVVLRARAAALFLHPDAETAALTGSLFEFTTADPRLD
jgi:hypothetical protein